MKKTILITAAYTMEADTDEVWNPATGYPTEKFGRDLSEVFRPEVEINGFRMKWYYIQHKAVDGCRCAVLRKNFSRF